MPTLCKVEYKSANGWWTGHGSFNFIDPQKYVEKFKSVHADNVRLTDVDGNVYIKFPETVELCEWCDEEHAAPFDGKCLL